jgi:hypothetical protein
MNGQSNARVPLSVLVPVKNEAVNPVDCLASVSFAQEVVVVDSASTDGYASSGRSSWNSGSAQALAKEIRNEGSIPSKLAIRLSLHLEAGFS